jgi:hypothetical protein
LENPTSPVRPVHAYITDLTLNSNHLVEHDPSYRSSRSPRNLQNTPKAFQLCPSLNCQLFNATRITACLASRFASQPRMATKGVHMQTAISETRMDHHVVSSSGWIAGPHMIPPRHQPPHQHSRQIQMGHHLLLLRLCSFGYPQGHQGHVQGGDAKLHGCTMPVPARCAVGIVLLLVDVL